MARRTQKGGGAVSAQPSFSLLAAAIPSLPALAAGLHTLSLFSHPILPPNSTTDPAATPERLVQSYTIHAYSDAAQEAEAAAHVVRHILERMRRLASAYGEWTHFDTSAYFDLTTAQRVALVQINERVSTAHCTFFVEPLLPSFRAAVDLYLTQFIPGKQSRDVEINEHFYQVVQPQMAVAWQRANEVVTRTRRLLADEVSFLVMNAAEEERWRWQAVWDAPADRGLDPRLAPLLRTIPTITLGCEFPLPANRQPGRWRRLWVSRQRRLWRKRRGA